MAREFPSFKSSPPVDPIHGMKMPAAAAISCSLSRFWRGAVTT
jgi:hypothetical protein